MTEPGETRPVVPERTPRADQGPAHGLGELLFVYGTLRRGEAAESLLRGCVYCGEAETYGTLYDLGGYPALTAAGETAVHGELWRCPPETLYSLDAYEGVGEGLFERVRIELADAEAVWTYVGGPALRSRLRQAARLSSGLWSRATGAKP